MTFPLAMLFGPVLASTPPPPYNPVTDISGLLFFNSYNTGLVPANAIPVASGTRNITGSAPTMTVSIAGSGLADGYNGGTAILSGYVNAGNNGTFTIVTATGTAFTINNPSGVAEIAPVSANVAIVGQCDSYTDLVGGAVFSQATLANKFSVNTSDIPGKTVISMGQGTAISRSMSVTSAPLAGQLNGTQDWTFFTYFRPTAIGVSLPTAIWLAFDDSTVDSLVYGRHGSLVTAISCVTADAAGTTTTQTPAVSPGMTLGAWQLLAITHTGTTAEVFINGVSHGSVTSGTQRTRASLNRVSVSNRSTGATGLGTSRGFRAVDGAVARVMTATELLDLTAWCQTEYA